MSEVYGERWIADNVEMCFLAVHVRVRAKTRHWSSKSVRDQLLVFMSVMSPLFFGFRLAEYPFCCGLPGVPRVTTLNMAARKNM